MMDSIQTVPEITLTPNQIDNLLGELHDYHAIYGPLFTRREQREWSEKYLHGLLLEIPRKSIEPMVLSLEGADPNAVRAMQQFISEGSWDDATILKQHWQEVDKSLGDDDGILILDESDFLKQGSESVGVKRQYCGEVGKVANCQAGVYLGYVSAKGYTLLSRRLYLPEEWLFDSSYEERRNKCAVPKDVKFMTKPALGFEMIKAVHSEGTLRCRWVVCDESFGRDTNFLDDISSLGLWYYAEVPIDTQVWEKRPVTAVPEWSGRGRKPTQKRLVEGEPDAVTVYELAQTVEDKNWSLSIIKEGSKGPIIAHFARLRVIAVRDGLPGDEVWLIFRRDVFTGELKAYLSNAPLDISFETLVRISGMRWPIETSFEFGKQFIGFGDYEVRSWRGWHHHMTLCILSHFFLVRMQLKLKENAPALTLPQVHLLLTVLLPKRHFDVQWALEVLEYRQKRNHTK